MGVMTYSDMTDEEYDALDEELTRTIPRFGPPGSGRLEQRETRLFGLDDITRTWLSVKAKADNKTPAQIINEMVHEKIAAASA
jgi:hypothetical protein